MYMDMVNPVLGEQYRVAGSELGVQQSLYTLQRAFTSAEDNAPDQVSNLSPFLDTEPKCRHQDHRRDRLQGDLWRDAGFPGDWLPHGPCYDSYTPVPEFFNFVRHIRFNGRREEIREIGNGQHWLNISARRRCAESMPAIVKSRPLTN